MPNVTPGERHDEHEEGEAVIQAPQPTGGPSGDHPHFQLYQDVIKTLNALPDEFSSSLQIQDVRATDTFSLNTALGASIEDAVVKGLNRLREVWDPDGKYVAYRFERQAQAFPDVRLVSHVEGDDPIIMGIELKGWFALAKEGEPTFRFEVNEDVCAPLDLLVIFPWLLSDVIAGRPVLMRPFVAEAKYAARLRNYYWTHQRRGKGKMGVIPATHRQPYPAQKTDQVSDRAEEDGGGNFGRVSRYGLMDDFIRSILVEQASGIPIKAWITFLKIFSDSKRHFDTFDAALSGALRGYAAQNSDGQKELIDLFERALAVLRESPAPQAIGAKTAGGRSRKKPARD